MMDRRHILAALAAAPFAARAQGQPPRILVGFPAGGSVDTTARRFADFARGKQAETVLVEQKVGAGGRIAIAALKDSAPDGQTLLLSPSSMFTIYPHAYRKLAYNPAADFIPVAPLALSTCGFGVGPMVPGTVKTLAQLADWLKANPDKAAYASPAAGAMPHFLGNQFEHAAGLKLTHAPYRGAAPGMQDLMGGQIASGCFSIGDFLPHLASGRVRLLGVTDKARSRFAPDVPTFEEQGFKGIVGVESYGLFLPARTPQAAVDKLADIARAAVREPAVIEALAKLGFEPLSLGSADYTKRLAAEREYWGPVVKASGFSSDD
ncbi:Bug family tripartite tricarboxylate transporter substrate binding protein [Roseateles asaccharophilus]|uniref:Tripartite-type tricarboxylate transporter receptor subunit TctC n=1 Tax=Roseateles asaccharophilus TaxID=582607 RepID=A0ABU2A6C2_9BURK|nr:Bug family tripartite tricarboxylate transporter substrate binding protein [Roseateles asaccharophilus]MDR7332747.1 tripartite-type tricarboxylate transporter receptor subunit TctC [Roseateles asaccharophilus]